VPWTALGTVRQNITFGKPYDGVWYNQVVHACALEPDFKLMQDGDLTWIGERRGNLSGGQKQRIATLASTFLKFCIQDIMIASGGTVVLATHQTELFPLSTILVVMQDGKQVYCDRYKYSGVKSFFPNLVGKADQVSHDHKLSSQQMTLVTNQRSRSNKELKPKLSMPLKNLLDPDAKEKVQHLQLVLWEDGLVYFFNCQSDICLCVSTVTFGFQLGRRGSTRMRVMILMLIMLDCTV
jgi:hypothetical protein